MKRRIQPQTDIGKYRAEPIVRAQWRDWIVIELRDIRRKAPREYRQTDDERSERRFADGQLLETPAQDGEADDGSNDRGQRDSPERKV